MSYLQGGDDPEQYRHKLKTLTSRELKDEIASGYAFMDESLRLEIENQEITTRRKKRLQGVAVGALFILTFVCVWRVT